MLVMSLQVGGVNTPIVSSLFGLEWFCLSTKTTWLG